LMDRQLDAEAGFLTEISSFRNNPVI